MFKEDRKNYKFTWQDLGGIDTGRPNLGQQVPVQVYRLLQYTMRDVLIAELGEEGANKIIVKAGKEAGFHFCKTCWFQTWNSMNSSPNCSAF